MWRDTNIASQKLCEKLGVGQDGMFKEFVSCRTDSGGAPIYESTLQYALLQRKSFTQRNSLPSIMP